MCWSWVGTHHTSRASHVEYRSALACSTITPFNTVSYRVEEPCWVFAWICTLQILGALVGGDACRWRTSQGWCIKRTLLINYIITMKLTIAMNKHALYINLFRSNLAQRLQVTTVPLPILILAHAMPTGRRRRKPTWSIRCNQPVPMGHALRQITGAICARYDPSSHDYRRLVQQ